MMNLEQNGQKDQLLELEVNINQFLMIETLMEINSKIVVINILRNQVQVMNK